MVFILELNMTKKTVDDIQEVINNKLKRDLENFEVALDKINKELIEYMQLEKTIAFMKEHKSSGFKTKVDVGGNMFMQATVDKIEPILIDVGLKVYLELEIDEALKFLRSKINILKKESSVIREESLKVRSEIKILLMYLASTN